MRRLFVSLLGFVAAVGAATVSAPDATATRAAVPTSSSIGLPALAEQQRYRAELGLRADTAFVTDLNARWAGGALPGAGTEGSVFTADEEQELDEREEAAYAIAEAARELAAGSPATFGGVYIDHASGKTVVLVTRDADDFAGMVRARSGRGDRLAVRVVRYSLADLQRIAALAAVETSSGVSVDERENSVAVGLPKDSAAARASVTARLRPSDAGAVRFYEAPAPSFTGVSTLNAPPVKGGQIILMARPDGLWNRCTSAFDAYRQTRTDAGIYVYDRYMLTAGHCKTAVLRGPDGSRASSTTSAPLTATRSRAGSTACVSRCRSR